MPVPTKDRRTKSHHSKIQLLRLWASNDGTGLKTTDDEKRKQVKYIERRLKELEKGLEACVKACLNVMKRENERSDLRQVSGSDPRGH